MNQYDRFIFKKWEFDRNSKKLTLHYSFDNVLDFHETYDFDFDFIDFDLQSLERAIDNLFFMAGVSYYKMYLPGEIEIAYGHLDQNHAAFFSKTYQKGLGEYFYKNSLDPRTEIIFKPNCESLAAAQVSGDGMLVGVGGGKDSLLSVELLRDLTGITTWTVGHQYQLEPLIQNVELPHIWVTRTYDPKVNELNMKGALNGHIPISAIYACLGTVVGVLTGRSDVVVSNERSADEPTLIYQGVEINHQYSKSSEFETDYQKILGADFGSSQRYYSLLRPLSELRIAELFANNCFEKYQYTFSSCNKSLAKPNEPLTWCGKCAKCCFVYLMFAPFVSETKLSLVFKKNLLLDPLLDSMYRQLLGIEGDKPLDCVGEVRESRVAMEMMKKVYPELKKYEYDLDENYDYKSIEKDFIPDYIRKLILNRL